MLTMDLAALMANRYFVTPPINTDMVTLAGPEAHHMIHVMRADTGAEVSLFDGSGAEVLARVIQIDRSQVKLKVLSRTDTDRESPIDVTLAVSLPKGDRQKWLVEKAVELGVRRIVPLRTARSVADSGEKALKRLGRTVIEASKQCGRNRLLQIGEPVSWSDFARFGDDVRSCRLLAHPRSACPDGEADGHAGPWLPENLPDRVILAVGPEGGFTGDEVALAMAADWRMIDLGPRILRIETAALVLVAMVAERSLLEGRIDRVRSSGDVGALGTTRSSE